MFMFVGKALASETNLILRLKTTNIFNQKLGATDEQECFYWLSL